jgi:hypothetical protein
MELGNSDIREEGKKEGLCTSSQKSETSCWGLDLRTLWEVVIGNDGRSCQGVVEEIVGMVGHALDHASRGGGCVAKVHIQAAEA